MKKRLIKRWMGIALAVALAGSLAACGSSSSSSDSSGDTEEVKEYVSAEELANVFSDPDAYKGKYIVLTGKVFNKIDSTGNSDAAYQAYYDTENYEDDFVVYCPADFSLSEGEYFEVDGKITGAQKFETYLGAQREVLCIQAGTVTEKSYTDVVVPAIAETTPEDAVAEQHGVSVKVDKVEFAETETRVWITETNNSADGVDIYPGQAKIVQNGTQYEYNWDSSTRYETGAEEPSDELLPGASSSGLIVFPAIDPSQEFQVYFDSCYSDNYDIQFDSFVITVPAAA